jgi:hypothetical protein
MSESHGAKTARAHLENSNYPYIHSVQRSNSGSRRASLPAPQRTTTRPATTGRVSINGSMHTVADCDALSSTSSRRSVGRDSGWPVRSHSSSRTARVHEVSSTALRSSLQVPDGLTLQLPSELGRTLSGAMSPHPPNACSNRSNSGALQDATNSAAHTDITEPLRPRSRNSEASHISSVMAASDALNFPATGLMPSGIENRSTSSGRRGTEQGFVGMGKADEELNRSSKREMSVLQQVQHLHSNLLPPISY